MNFRKVLCLGAVLAACTSGFADETDVSQSQSQSKSQQMKKQNNGPMFEQGLGLPANKFQCGYNAPGCISLRNGWDFDVFGSFIYWHASQEFMDTAYVPQLPTPSTTTNNGGAVAFQNVNYEPGFKVGFGFNTNYDGWTFFGEYTWLHQTISNSATAPLLPSGAAGYWNTNDWFTSSTTRGPAVTTFASVNSSWKLGFDMVDAAFSRPFYEGAQLVVLPYGGLRGLWLRQNFNIGMASAAGATVVSSDNSAHSWSVGPVTGMSGHWLLGSGFRFEGKAAGSILYTRYTKIAHNEHGASPLLAVKSSMTNLNALRPAAQLALGLGWGTYCCNSGFYFDISVDYEFNYFWEQNVMREWVGQLQGYADAVAGLALHGLTASLRFDF